MSQIQNKLHSAVCYLRHALTAKRGGHGVHSPFVFALCENVFYAGGSFYHFSSLHELRKKLLRDQTVIDTGGFGAGSRTFRGCKRSVSEIAKRGISSRWQSEILYRLANFTAAGCCVELGTSLGLNTLYLAAHNPANKVITVEGNAVLSNFARALAGEWGATNIRFVNAAFDAALPEILKQTVDPVLVYIDGDHSYEATLHYFQTLISTAQADTVLVFDDIYWSAGMCKAWKEISSHPEVKLSIDVYHFGLVFFRKEFREKIHYRLWL